MENLSGDEAVVVPLDSGWSDVGDWSSLWEVSEKDEAGNASRGNTILADTHNCLVHADNRLVSVLGVDDLVVIETADAVLVASKERTHDLKALVAQVAVQNEELTISHRLVHRPHNSAPVTAGVFAAC